MVVDTLYFYHEKSFGFSPVVIIFCLSYSSRNTSKKEEDKAQETWQKVSRYPLFVVCCYVLVYYKMRK